MPPRPSRKPKGRSPSVGDERDALADAGKANAPERTAAAAERDEFMARYRERSQAKNQAARDALVPLEPGERPVAVTIAALVALVLAVANLGAYAAGVEVGGERPTFPQFALQVLLLVTAVGMWRVRYWAVLGMQVFLLMLIVFFSLALITAENAIAVAAAVAIVAAAGTLFWFLVKVLARIQMPERG